MEKKSSKDTASNLFNRYIWLVDIIYRRGSITFEEINASWQRSMLNLDGDDLPLRTFHNHRKAIEQMFDINIECDKRNGYTYYLENKDDIERTGVRSWLLNAFSISSMITESYKLKDRILFEQIPSGQIFLAPVIEAMRDNLSVEITYQSFWSETPYTFQVYPYCIKAFNQRWYLIAYSPNKNHVLIYAFDRIKNMILTNTYFTIPNDFDGNTFFKDCFGIIEGEGKKAERVLLKVDKNQACYIRTLPLHHSQKEIDNNPDYSVFSYYIKPTFDFRQELLSHGADVEVLEPKWFRDEIAAIILEQYKIYRNDEL